MFPITLNYAYLLMAVILFLLGLTTIIAGIVILVSKVFNGEIKELAQETTVLAQKGISDDLSGLVGNASTLIEALNELIRTAAGIGSFLIIMGFVSIGIACFLVAQAF